MNVADRLFSVSQVALLALTVLLIGCSGKESLSTVAGQSESATIDSIFEASAGRELTTREVESLRLAVNDAWPGQERFGKQTVDRFAHLVLRATADTDFQQRMLNSAFSVAGVEISPRRFAILNDLVELSHNRPQQFGILRDENGELRGPAINTGDAEILRSMLAIGPLGDEPGHADPGVDMANPLEAISIDPPTLPDLRKKLLEALKIDHSIRSSAGWDDDKRRIDRDNAAFIRDVLSSHGVPDAAKVGVDGAHAALVLMHHSLDSQEMRANLPRIEALKERESLSGQDYALFYDRTMALSGEPQRYGTQLRVVDGRTTPHPIEDEAHVDSRRATVGLEPLSAYLSQ